MVMDAGPATAGMGSGSGVGETIAGVGGVTGGVVGGAVVVGTTGAGSFGIAFCAGGCVHPLRMMNAIKRIEKRCFMRDRTN
jgi:hypothetical protein